MKNKAFLLSCLVTTFNGISAMSPYYHLKREKIIQLLHDKDEQVNQLQIDSVSNGIAGMIAGSVVTVLAIKLFGISVVPPKKMRKN